MMAAMSMDSGEGVVPTGHVAHVAITPRRREDPLLALFSDQYAPMVRLASALLGNRAQAEEVVQEAFVKIEPHLARLEPDGQVPYLRRCVMNGARSAVRRDRAKKRQPVLVRETAASPEDRAVQRDDQERLLAVLDRLPMRQRQCLVLRYYDGRSDAEVADALGISLGSAKTHIRRGLEALKTNLEELR